MVMRKPERNCGAGGSFPKVWRLGGGRLVVLFQATVTDGHALTAQVQIEPLFSDPKAVVAAADFLRSL